MTTPASTCSKCGASLPADAAFCLACGAATGVPVQPETSVLDKLQVALQDRYKVERELGRGGMATVFLAQDIRHDRPVAIKVLHPELAASVGAERFDREIKVAARLQHPHILSLYDSGAADGLLFYVMPFVVGESLRDRLDREQMVPVEDAINITLEVADALGYAHGLGIVHRDIKPENIMLSGGHALVADFGIARAVESAGEQKLTQTGTAVGTPLYMSPEQAMGDEVGPTSDLYSLGCVAYEMLTGQPPFTGANARAIMARHTMEMVPGIRLVRDTVPEEVEDALLAVLSKVPADRPKSAALFAEMLGTPLGATATRRIASRSRPTMARGRISTPVTGMARPRNRLIAGIIGVLLAFSAVSWWATHRGSHATGATGGLDPKHIAVLYFNDLSPQKDLGYLADGLTEGLITTLAGALRSARDVEVVSKSGSDKFRGSPLGLDSVARALGAGTLVLGDVSPSGDSISIALRLVDGNSNATIQSVSFKGPKSNALAIVTVLAERAASLVQTQLGGAIRVQEQRQATRNADAWVLVQRAERLRKLADSLAAAGDTTSQNARLTEADTLLAQAEPLDAKWVEPPLLRGAIAYSRSRRYVDDQIAAGLWIEHGLSHLQRAAARDSADPDLLELRGNLRYWRWLLQLEPDAVKARALFASAKKDLETATTLSPSQAGAYASLSSLYANDPEKTGIDVAEAARHALEADAFLSNADKVSTRLFLAWYDLNEFIKAKHACDDGHRHFPAQPKFTECQLLVMTMPRADSLDPRRAWAIADSLMRLTPPSDTAYQRLNGRLLVAAVLARAGLADSARHVVDQARTDNQIDPQAELPNIKAFIYSIVGDKAKAVAQLKVYVAANANRGKGLADNPGWWFGSLQDDPGFKQLVAPYRTTTH